MAELSQKINEVIERSVVNFSKSVPTDAIKSNVDSEMHAGMRPKIIRSTDGNCCAWCSSIAGIYYADQAPADIYRRHDHCSCTVTYVSEKGYQDAHTKKWINRQELKARKARIEDDKDYTSHLSDNLRYQSFIRKEEDRITEKATEEAVCCTKSGKKIFSKTGGSDRVDFTPEELLQMKGAILTHNHPSGGTFSCDDVALFTKHGLFRIRAAGEKTTYQLEAISQDADGAGFREAYESVQVEANRIKNERISELTKLYKSDNIDMAELHKQISIAYKNANDSANSWFKENAKKYGYRYSVIRR